MSARYYLPLRHDVIARTLLNSIRKLYKPDLANLPRSYEDEDAVLEGDHEYWWNIPVKTSSKVPHKKPDFIIWNKRKKRCTIVEINSPAKVKVSVKEIIFGLVNSKYAAVICTPYLDVPVHVDDEVSCVRKFALVSGICHSVSLHSGHYTHCLC